MQTLEEQSRQGFVIICGAGVAGLAAAWWMQRAGWRVLVVEQAEELRDGGHMMGLSGPGLATVRRMDLVARLGERAYPDMGQHIYRDRRGREILRINYREALAGIEWLTLRRGVLVQELRAALPTRDIAWRFGVTVQEALNQASSVRVSLSDGSCHEADLLIAADGVHSSLRRRHFAADANCLHPLGYRYASYEVQDHLLLGQDFLSYAEPGIQTEYYGLCDGRLAALHVWRSREAGFVPPAQRHSLLRTCTARSFTGVRATLEAVENPQEIVIDDLALVELPSWRQGRILLLGDAAHSLSLISGQGAGVALASASILAEELERAAAGGVAPSSSALESALARHDQRLRPTILRLQHRSRKLAPMYVPSSRVGFALRNLVLRTMPDVLLKKYFASGLKSEAQALAALA
ncbi:FAD-binding protein [Herbaspirillum seropedicae]|uniref:2-polyprenyl-6-methoxyphenol hydroxylase protein n=2 Tax=Herbaspirillum seropedicae TaxID=964 RepID=D8IXN2_HERSS|nr:FAD-dependent oxidoreductase [Herbaspirillum seropedicae]ADJ64134.1 2-polyprenyl-6-methoxyphenol hydroxylase protein [Herbaspirillum seropedicae SmR1]AKN66089.1 2-polyprenyl-6-methoxyphenol hydroxylase [Herbaspirillum seropedicae]NQE30822.1 2-polyprenyl-6-methoxyphenol hydroxylase [Herbaspirillum seropedicae]UMU22080.1 FAD-binding protein [Herbaspirillum seropedicae]